MIRLLDDALERMLQAEVPLPKGEIDIAFETPNRTWSNGVNQPTLNVFMWDLRRSAHEARSGKVVATQGGSQGYKLAPPRISCRYHLTAWASDVRDEHRILSSVLATLLPLRTMPEKYLTGELAEARPLPDFRTGTPHVKDFVDFWSALQGEVKGGIDLLVSLTMDSGISIPLGQPITAPGARTIDTKEPTRRSGTGREGRVAGADAVGRVARTAWAATVVLEDGRFWIDAQPGDEVTVDTSPPRTATVPDQGLILVGEPATVASA